MTKKTLFLILLINVVLFLPVLVVGGDTTPQAMVQQIKRAIGSIGVSIVAIGWVIAGILWLTSAGNTEKTGTARKATVAAVIGTVLVALAYVAYDVISSLLLPGSTGVS